MDRIDKINAEIKRQLAEIISYGVKDPRLHSGMVSILRVDTTKDLKYCKVYFSVIGSSGEEALSALRKAAGYIRGELSGKLTVRCVPELQFVLDDSIEYSIRLDKILKDLK